MFALFPRQRRKTRGARVSGKLSEAFLEIPDYPHPVGNTDWDRCFIHEFYTRGYPCLIVKQPFGRVLPEKAGVSGFALSPPWLPRDSYESGCDYIADFLHRQRSVVGCRRS